MAAEWFVQLNGQQFGPYTSQQLKEAAVNGQITTTTMIAQAGQQQWFEAGSVPGLFQSQPNATTSLQFVETDNPIERYKQQNEESSLSMALLGFFAVFIIAGAGLVVWVWNNRQNSNQVAAVSTANSTQQNGAGTESSNLQRQRKELELERAKLEREKVELQRQEFEREQILAEQREAQHRELERREAEQREAILKEVEEKQATETATEKRKDVEVDEAVKAGLLKLQSAMRPAATSDGLEKLEQQLQEVSSFLNPDEKVAWAKGWGEAIATCDLAKYDLEEEKFSPAFTRLSLIQSAQSVIIARKNLGIRELAYEKAKKLSMDSTKEVIEREYGGSR